MEHLFTIEEDTLAANMDGLMEAFGCNRDVAQEASLKR